MKDEDQPTVEPAKYSYSVKLVTEVKSLNTEYTTFVKE